jgi:hypothetical protein
VGDQTLEDQRVAEKWEDVAKRYTLKCS